jgi:hypothetical protein
VETEAQRAARYATKDVTDKLGIKPGFAVRAAGSKHDAELLARARKKAGRPFARAGEKADVVLYWPATASGITRELVALRKQVTQSAGIWVISAKRDREHAGRPYLGTDVIALGLAAGLVDNKVCSISDVDTAIRFVIRRSERTP